jgi:hypothetical protein
MADAEAEKGEEKNDEERNTALRTSLSDAYAALLGDQSRQSFGAFTFEEALDANIERIEGVATQLRPNLLERTARIMNRVIQAADTAKALDPDLFKKPDPNKDVNTDETTEALALAATTDV